VFAQNFGSTSPARGGFKNLQKTDTMAGIHNGTKADNHNNTKALISTYGTKAHTTTYGTKADNESFTHYLNITCSDLHVVNYQQCSDRILDDMLIPLRILL
jgi:hypothetical protein